jgi:hypothetical protein
MAMVLEFLAERIGQPGKPDKTVTLMLPRGITSFEKEGSFRMTASVRGGTEFEILSKKIVKGTTS